MSDSVLKSIDAAIEQLTAARNLLLNINEETKTSDTCSYILTASKTQCKRPARRDGFCTAHYTKQHQEQKQKQEPIPDMPICLYMEPLNVKKFKRCKQAAGKNGLCVDHNIGTFMFMARDIKAAAAAPAPPNFLIKTPLLTLAKRIMFTTKTPRIIMDNNEYIARAKTNMVIFKKYADITSVDMKTIELAFEDIVELGLNGFPICPKILAKYHVDLNVLPIVIELSESFAHDLTPYRDGLFIDLVSGYIVYKTAAAVPVIVARKYNGMETWLGAEDFVAARNFSISAVRYDIWNDDLKNIAAPAKINKVDGRLLNRDSVFLSASSPLVYVFEDDDFYVDNHKNSKFSRDDIERMRGEGYGISRRLLKEFDTA